MMKKVVQAALFLFISGIYGQATVENVTTIDGYDNTTYNRGNLIEIQVVFSEVVNVSEAGGTPYLKLETGLGEPYPGDDKAPYNSVTGSNTLIFS